MDPKEDYYLEPEYGMGGESDGEDYGDTSEGTDVPGVGDRVVCS